MKRPCESRQAAARNSRAMVQSVNHGAARRGGSGDAVGKPTLGARRPVDHTTGMRVRPRQRMARVPDLRRPGRHQLTLALTIAITFAVPPSALNRTLSLQFAHPGRTGVQGAIGRVCELEAEATKIAPDTL